MDLGTVGVWSGRLQRRATDEARAQVSEWEHLGYGALWVPESPAGKDVLTFASVLLGATSRIVIATGIAIIWVRDPYAMANAGRTIADAFPERFLLGVGVSHKSTAVMRGHEYAKPLSAMRSYLTAMSEAPFDGHPPTIEQPTLVAALGPKMIALAGDLADGIHPFLTTPEHTATARSILGEGKMIAVEQGVMLQTNPEAARSAARTNLSRFLQWPNYRNHFLRSGFSETDLADGGSDRLIDATYAWGDEDTIRGRIEAHIHAGADHVALQVIDGGADEPTTLRQLAGALVG